MALDPRSEQRDLNVPEDYRRDHPEEHPSDWGWHAEWGRRTGRGAGWVVAAILLVMNTATHYNFAGNAWLIGFAAIIAVFLERDHQHRQALAGARHRQPSVSLLVFLIVAGLILVFAPKGGDIVAAFNLGFGGLCLFLGVVGLALRLTRAGFPGTHG